MIDQAEYDRLKIEDAIEQIPNRFELILAAGQRVRQLYNGHKATIPTTSREPVTALREIAAGKVGRELLRNIK